jgi:hypothetical protein
MTKRDFYNAIVKADVADEIKAFAEKAIAELNAKNSARAVKAAEKRAEVNEPLVAKFNEILADGKEHFAADVAEALGVKVAKAAVIAKLAGADKVKVKVGKAYRTVYKAKADVDEGEDA